MNVPALIFHEDFYTYSPAIIGDEAVRLGSISGIGLPIAATVCITKETLLEIAQYNKLDRLITQYTQTFSAQSKKALEQSFLRQAIPEHLKDALLEWHHTAINSSFASVFASHTQGVSCRAERAHVLGDTNTLESIFEVWWDALQPVLEHRQGLSNFLQYVPSAICIQKEATALSSGNSYSVHPLTGSKSDIYIESVHSWYLPSLAALADIFEVQTNNYQVTNSQLHEQEEIFIQKNDELETKALPKELTQKFSLSDEQAAQLAQYTTKAKKRFLDHVTVSWILSKHGFELTRCSPYHVNYTQLQRNTQASIIATAGNPHKLLEYSHAEIDGIFFKSEYVFMSQGLHPQYLLKSKKHTEILADELTKALELARKTVRNKPLFYRPLQLDSYSLRSLAHSETYEPKEENPFLGFNGALRAINMPEVFRFELQQLEKAATKSTAPLTVVLPYVRSAGELKKVLAIIQQTKLMQFEHVTICEPIVTPAQLIDITSFIQPAITSFSIDIENLGAYILGYDPENKEVADQYTLLDTHLQYIFSALAPLLQASDKKVYAYISTFSRQYVEYALNAGCTGIIIKPKNVRYAKESVIEFEKQKNTY